MHTHQENAKPKKKSRKERVNKNENEIQVQFDRRFVNRKHELQNVRNVKWILLVCVQ